MLDFLGNASSVLITVVIVAGFLALGAVFVFEISTMFYFWIKHSLSDSGGAKFSDGFRKRRVRRIPDPQQPSVSESRTAGA
jgi:hypothetical protein